MVTKDEIVSWLRKAEREIGDSRVVLTDLDSAGGAAGQLYGAFFLRSADAATGKIELSTRDVGEMLRAGLDGVLMKGRKKQGERTMVDALLPAVEGFEHAAQTGKGTVAALREAVVRAEWGMKSTAGDDDSPTGFMQSRNRRSEDAGAMSSYLLLRALLDAVD